MQLFIILATSLMFVFSLIGVWISRMFRPGTYMIYAQTFASGSMIGISLLHFIPEAIHDIAKSQIDFVFPYHYMVIILVFTFFCIIESKATHSNENNQPDFHEMSDDSVKDFSVFLMHRFTAITNNFMRLTAYFFLCLHSILIAYFISTENEKGTHVSILISTLFEKMVESLVIALISRKEVTETVQYWILLVFYSLITPVSIIILSFIQIGPHPLLAGSLLAVSAGLFLYIGLLLWRKTFLTPFDWQKTEIIIVCTVFICAIIIQALTAINPKIKSPID